MPRKASKTQLIDAEMASKLRRAAEAIGATPDQLAGMLIDAGFVKLPETQAFENLSIEMLGKRMNLLLKDKTDSDPEGVEDWYNQLLPVQRAALIVDQRNRGYASATIAAAFGTSAANVSRIYNQYSDDLGANVLEQRQQTVAGLIQNQMESLQSRVLELPSGDNGYSELSKLDLAWKIFKEGQKMLREIGVVSETPKQLEVTHQQAPEQDTLKRAEELTKMRSKRMIEIGEAKPEE